MLVINRKKPIGYEPTLHGAFSENAKLEVVSNNAELMIYKLSVDKEFVYEELSVKWKLENIGAKGTWSASTNLDKRFRTDWELPQIYSSIYHDIPIVCLFGYDDENIMTAACSDAVNELQMSCGLREEDNHFYVDIHFFKDSIITEDYSTLIYINKGQNPFCAAVMQARQWIIKSADINLAPVPTLAKKPVYSTWYSFHQDLAEQTLIEECREAKTYGYDVVIIDDGWQTNDDNRGYDFTGDWNPERFPTFPKLIKELQDIGMAVMIWFSVPFCGKKSNAYKEFAGKFLTEDHPWAPVFDPRFPDVREYLVSKYVRAIKDWNLQGLKLDFIDDFKVYPDTEINELKGRDTLSVALGVSRLIQEVKHALHAINPDVLIEFRQKYISPPLASLGNMFRAFDCPSDPLMNRMRTTDVKLISGDAAVHSDMLTWSKNEPVHIGALQFTSVLFSVPQLSVLLKDRSDEEKQMIKFFTNYWIENAHVLLSQDFNAKGPLSNYTSLEAVADDKRIYGIYEDVVLEVNLDASEIHIINGKLTERIYIQEVEGFKDLELQVFNCLGDDVTQANVYNGSYLAVPANGIIKIFKR
jgi:alpha-galactosidase